MPTDMTADAGAHFYRCDFQVHTPRDLNWKGEGAETDDERRAYAAAFIAACRARRLHAVGITDHHDMAFFPFIRAAAAEETTQDGQPMDAASRIVVFPGMELTIAVPCQAILLFDADFPPELLPQALPALGIPLADSLSAKHGQTHRIPSIASLNDVYEQLDRLDVFRGRYILLPNVSDRGEFTLLRSGFAPKYVEMRCVGGYVDGSLSGYKKFDIISGRATRSSWDRSIWP